MNTNPQAAIKIYICHRMTGRKNSELVEEAAYTKQMLEARGFVVLDPILEEKITADNKVCVVTPVVLETYWRRDKELIRDADIILDYNTQGQSDGTNNEVGYARYCLWKPVVRVWAGPGGAISRIEDDVMVPTLAEALDLITVQYGTYEKLRDWRTAMWDRCFIKWIEEQKKMNARYECFAEV